MPKFPPPVAVGAAIVPATLVVAAFNSLDPTRADYQCVGVDDHLTIQAALDALPAIGGEVKLLEGTYNVQLTINLDSNQTLRGCGKNTILTTSTADLIFLSAVGVFGTELTGIVIADLQIDGGGGAVSDCGIYFEYVDYSFIQNVYSRRHASGTGSWITGIELVSSDFNQIVNNTCQGNQNYGIDLYLSENNIISGNTCQGNMNFGIHLYLSHNNTFSGNTCQGNYNSGIILSTSHNNTVVSNACRGNLDDGIILFNSNSNTVSGNTCQGNGSMGIALTNSNNNNVSGNTYQENGSGGIVLTTSSHNTISGNTCRKNSQTLNNTYDNIILSGSTYNLIFGNICRSPTVGTTLTAGELAGATDIDVTDTTDFEVGDGVVLDLGGANVEYHRISAITAGAPGVITIPAPGLINAQGAGETIDVPKAQYGINISDAACDSNLVTNNDLYDDGFGTGSFNDAGTGTIKRGNRGAIASGEELVASGALTAGLTDAFAFAWQNPHISAILVTRVVIDVTTPGGTANSVLDVGSAADATTHSDNLIDGMDLNGAGVYDNLDNPGANGKSKQKVDANGGASDWVTGQILVENAAALAGKYYIYYTGV